MNYVKTENNTVLKYPYRIKDLRRDYPNVSFPAEPSESTLVEYGVYPVKPTPRPSGDVVVEVDPKLQSGMWVQAWSVRDYTPEEADAQLAEYRSGLQCSMRQARLALLQQGLLSQVEAAIAAMPEPDKSAVTIEWEYAHVVDRNSPWMSAMAAALGLTDEQLDGLFELALTL